MKVILKETVFLKHTIKMHFCNQFVNDSFLPKRTRGSPNDIRSLLKNGLEVTAFKQVQK